MMISDLGSLRIGQVLTTNDFQVTRADLNAHVERSFLGNVLGCCEEQLSTASNVGGIQVGVPWGLVCPTDVVVGRAVAMLQGCDSARTLTIEEHAISNIRVLGSPMVGEPLAAAASVRFRSQARDGADYLTLDVTIHRPGGVALICFELGWSVQPQLDAA